ncbi:MAG: hypothetical protein DHS20C16_27490 [Phycisphaerae bacterium]|nr:MAG: hypothetical protein DHS20C16_27490 [Phycisphaerae bacterium]
MVYNSIMRMRNSILFGCIGAWLVVPTLFAQSEPTPIKPVYPETPPRPRRSPPPVLPPMQPDPYADPKLLDGFWPTDHMIDLFVKRSVEQATEAYNLRPEQAAKIQGSMTKRWTNFMHENRADIQPLMNEYAEANLADKPPTPETVSDWAARATPVYRLVLGNLLEGEFEFRSALDPEQQALFDEHRVERRQSLERFQSRLRRWSVGNFEEKEWWNPSGQAMPEGLDPTGRWFAQIKSNDEKSDRFKRAAIEQFPQRVKSEFAVWEQYVRNYCDHFELDQSQRNAAMSMLREMLNRAFDHVYKRRDLIAKLEAKIANPETVDPDLIEKDMIELYGPLDAMFRELSARVERLPTKNQRSRVTVGKKAYATPTESESTESKD